jgi:hypothetical protein
MFCASLEDDPHLPPESRITGGHWQRSAAPRVERGGIASPYLLITGTAIQQASGPLRCRPLR